MRKLITAFIISLGVVLFFIPACTGGESVKPGTKAYIVDTYVGDVSVSHDSGNSWIPIEIGMILRENDMLKTGNDSFADIIMPERGIFRISFDTIIHLKNLTQRLEQISVKKGKLYVNITEKLKSEEKFTVETDVAVVAARGTQFTVETDGDTTTTTVNEGKVVAMENIDIEGDVAAQEALDEALEVEVAPNEEVSFDKESKEKLEEQIKESVKEGNTDEAVDKAKEHRKNNTQKKKNVMTKDKDTWNNLSKEEKKEQIRMKLDQLQDEKKRKMEEKKDQEMLEKAMEKGRGTNSMAGKKVGKNQTTIQDDIKDDVANKKVDETKKKLGIDNKIDEKFDESVSDEDAMDKVMKDKKGGAGSLIDKYKEKKGK